MNTAFNGASELKHEAAFNQVSESKATAERWRRLHGSFRESGYRIEWHDFVAKGDIDWSTRFHPYGLEICLNVSGTGEVRTTRNTLELTRATAGFYLQHRSGLKGFRRGGSDRHLFATIGLSLRFLKAQIGNRRDALQPGLRRLLNHASPDTALVSEPSRLTNAQQELVTSLQQPPVNSAGHGMWYRAKALEIVSTVLFQPLPSGEFFCERVKRLNRERAEKVVALLKENLANPPSLQEVGRRVGCSHFYWFLDIFSG